MKIQFEIICTYLWWIKNAKLYHLLYQLTRFCQQLITSLSYERCKKFGPLFAANVETNI